MRHRHVQSKIKNQKSKIAPGFTLVEMLTVIGIIVLLVSILLPVVSAVRVKGHVADTQAMMARIGTGIQSYYSDFNAFPGPLHNGQIYNGGIPVTIDGIPGNNATQITQAENMLLGLLGGLVMRDGKVTYDPAAIGNGPVSLNFRNPKKYRAYMDKVSLSEGDYGDQVVDKPACRDSIVPEFLDRFPDPMPILYLRAKVGAPGIVSDRRQIGEQAQYDLKQIEAYTTVNIGLGKELPAQSEYRIHSAGDPLKHGLRSVNPNGASTDPPPKAGLAYVYPYELMGFLRHPSMPDTPRQKDGFIMVSAGPDRVYGTKDDLVYPATR
jgi:prepilin-type N-terminal cleavage/methylation domain-containing protein